MSNYSVLKALLDTKFYENSDNEITGTKANEAVKAMVDSLGAGYQYMGVATLTPTATDPGTPDYKCFYIASEAGTYTNFLDSNSDPLVVNDGEVAVLKYDTAWSKGVTGAATAASVTELGQYVDSPEWVMVVTDSEDKILEGITQEGVKQLNLPIDTPSTAIEHIDNPEWLSVTIDNEGKILEGIKRNGAKYIADTNIHIQSSESTKDIFNNLSSDKPDNNSGWICENGEYGGDNVKYSIPVKPNNKTRVVFKFRYNSELTDGTVAHICSIGDHNLGIVGNGVLISRGYIGKKTIFRAYHNNSLIGEQDMSDYSFQPHNGQTAFYVRYTGTYDGNSDIKLVWTASTISLTKNGVISESVNYTENESVYELTQALAALNEIEVRVICCTTRKVSELLHYDGMEIPMTAEYSSGIYNAFSITYTGSSSYVLLTVAASGASKVVTIGSFGTLTFNDNDSIDSVITAIDGLSDELSVTPYFTKERTFADLGWADGTTIYLYSTANRAENLINYPTSLPYHDAMPVCIPYAVDEKWHTVEMICDNNESYCAASLDGQTIYSAGDTEFSNIIIGGSYGSGVTPITCRDLEIDVDNVGDAEVISINDRDNGVVIKQLISSYNPRVLIWEGHVIDTLLEDGIAKDAEGKTIESGLSEGIDRLNLIFGKCEAAGYMPISLRQMIDWRLKNEPLPSKRCYLCIFDDWPAEYYVDFDIRGTFNKHDVKPNFAMIWTQTPTSFIPYTKPFVVNGHNYTMQEVVDIVRTNGGGICSHVNHQLIGRIVPSELWDFLKKSTYEAENLGLTTEVIVYPGGKFTETSHEILENSMFNIGVDVSFYNYNCRATNRFSLRRYGIDRQAHANTEFDDLLQ